MSILMKAIDTIMELQPFNWNELSFVREVLLFRKIYLYFYNSSRLAYIIPRANEIDK